MMTKIIRVVGNDGDEEEKYKVASQDEFLYHFETLILKDEDGCRIGGYLSLEDGQTYSVGKTRQPTLAAYIIYPPASPPYPNRILVHSTPEGLPLDLPGPLTRQVEVQNMHDQCTLYFAKDFWKVECKRREGTLVTILLRY
eukprot:scaffold103775_cov67-Attheya_sp.AAC.1